MVRINLINDMTEENAIRKGSFMKARILIISGVVAVAILSLVACSKKKTDESLNGMWTGQQTVTNGKVTTTQTYILKFDSSKLEISRTVRTGSLNNQREFEAGTYKLNKDLAEYSVNAHSCADYLNNGVVRPLNLTFTYTHNFGTSSSPESLKIDFRGGNVLVLSKVTDSDNTQKILDTYTNGCYVEQADGTAVFKQGDIKKVIPEVEVATTEVTPETAPAPQEDTLFKSSFD